MASCAKGKSANCLAETTNRVGLVLRCLAPRKDGGTGRPAAARLLSQIIGLHAYPRRVALFFLKLELLLPLILMIYDRWFKQRVNVFILRARAGIWACIECMIGRHGYLCFVMFPDERKEKRKDSGGETSNRVSPSGRFCDTRVEFARCRCRAEAIQPKGVRTNVAK